MAIKVSGQRGAAGSFGMEIARRIDELATFTSEPGRLTRLYLSKAHRAAADCVMAWMRDAGMGVRVDGTGTVVGRYEGASAAAPVLLIGSHIDTVRNAGKFDGNLGVLTAIAVVARLHAAATRLPFAIEVLAFGDEEGVRFPRTLGGSRAVAGHFDQSYLDDVDADGISRRQALVEFGAKPEAIAEEARDPAHVLGYLEVHIEQGPVLEAEGLPVAVVSAINGASRAMVTVTGESGHAGTVPLSLRKDALAAAAAMILAVEARAKREENLVATVGRIEVANAAGNTVPGLVQFSLDVRSPVEARRQAALTDIANAIEGIGRARGVTTNLRVTYDMPVSVADAGLMQRLGDAIEAEGVKRKVMPCGAGHDAMSFAGRMPFAMLFVRCKGGISHNPAEYASAEDIDVAARVLERCVLGLG